MGKRLKRIGFGLAVVHVLTYVFLSDWMMERKACDKYLQFTEQRFANPYNKNVSEWIHVSSCGDEFFRDLSPLEEVARTSNPVHQPIELFGVKTFVDGEFSQYVSSLGYPPDIYGTIQANTDTLGSKNCIIYDLCSMSSIPLFHTRVRYGYLFSSRPPDIHAMYYNGQGLTCTSNYLWLLFTWIEVTGEIKDPSQ